ncbi:hypothetical protein [Streptomyces sp. NPDC005408]|uniref:hypothetical protein n=1 Tax=Streptomyces sp. NPDC005408 TaxID=3155341 RepID=UPI00339E718B
MRARRASMESAFMEHRTAGTDTVFCSIGKRADGTEVLLLAFVFNPYGQVVATVAPIDATGVMWRHRTTRAMSIEITPHASLLDAVEGARLEAAERDTWTATDQGAVEAAYRSATNAADSTSAGARRRRRRRTAPAQSAATYGGI